LLKRLKTTGLESKFLFEQFFQRIITLVSGKYP